MRKESGETPFQGFSERGLDGYKGAGYEISRERIMGDVPSPTRELDAHAATVPL